MQRRKYLATLGSLAAGGAAVTGTGAFTTVSADRTATARVADDSDALLRLDALGSNANSAYAEEGNAQIAIDLSTNRGAGVNQGATTTVFDIFTVQNQGTQSVIVYVPNKPLGDQGAFDDSDSDGIYLDPQFSDMPRSGASSLATLPDGTVYGSLTNIGGTLYSKGQTFEEGLDDGVGSTAPIAPSAYTLDPGQTFDFGLYVRTSDTASIGSTNFDIPIKADAALADKYGTGNV